MHWDKDDPMNKTKWHLQQPALVEIEPPYVYTVVRPLGVQRQDDAIVADIARLSIQRRGDVEGLKAAVLAAVQTPIDRYIRKLKSFLPRTLRLAAHTRDPPIYSQLHQHPE
jgi:hypothetical protein